MFRKYFFVKAFRSAKISSGKNHGSAWININIQLVILPLKRQSSSQEKTKCANFGILQPCEKVKMNKPCRNKLVLDVWQSYSLSFTQTPSFFKTSLLFPCNMTVSYMNFVMGGLGGSKYRVSAFWGFLSMTTPWFVSNVENTNVWI